MKAVRFIAIFSFLTVFSFLAVLGQQDFCFSVVSAQETKDSKSVSGDKNAIKPIVSPTVTPVDATTSEPTFNPNPKERYRIGMYDVIEVNVSKHPELSRGSIKLDNAGRFSLPRIDKPIAALCKTENELADEITRIYKETYLRDPYVSVVVREQNSQSYSVIGAVKKPGTFFTNRDLTLLEVISYAGGPDVEFAGSKVQVARVGDISGCVDKEKSENGEGTVNFYGFTLSDILRGKTNPVLKPGDIVSVLDADIVYVYGNVNKEGQIKVKEPITLLQAIVSAEGLKPSSKSKVRILRQKEGSLEREELVFDLKEISQRKTDDPYLQPNDIVAISEDTTKSILRNIGKSFTNGIPSLLYKVQIP
ncbi:MAG TPA: polysaccharide biosynthesis/export family protein [Pyrinomonadaceae bacterium]|jgi:polysaccharide export outer membrane protein